MNAFETEFPNANVTGCFFSLLSEYLPAHVQDPWISGTVWQRSPIRTDHEHVSSPGLRTPTQSERIF